MTTSMPRDLPAHLARLCETQVLTQVEEQELFRLMNYLKYRANVVRARLDPQHSDEEAVLEVERMLARAGLVRDRIIKANMRLVISIVKKFVTPKHSFDELLSDGIVALMHAVDKFDYAKGFRFSTYAYRAVARNAYRTITDQQRRDARFDIGASEDLFNIPEQDRTSPLDEQQWTHLRSLMQQMMDRLDRREQFILRSRFALAAHRKVRTFQCLADKLGVSKERVRSWSSGRLPSFRRWRPTRTRTVEPRLNSRRRAQCPYHLGGGIRGVPPPFSLRAPVCHSIGDWRDPARQATVRGFRGGCGPSGEAPGGNGGRCLAEPGVAGRAAVAGRAEPGIQTRIRSRWTSVWKQLKSQSSVWARLARVSPGCWSNRASGWRGMPAGGCTWNTSWTLTSSGRGMCGWLRAC